MSDLVEPLKALIRKSKAPFTLNEASAAGGYSIDETRDALEKLVAAYPCRLQVTENGDLIYNFEKPMRERGERTWKDTILLFREWSWKLFKIGYKAAITVVLVVYFVVFVILLIALLLAASSSNDGKRGSKGGRAGGTNLGGVIDVFYSIFRWQTHTGQQRGRMDSRGYQYQDLQPRPGVLKTDSKSIIASVYDFVFGPEPARRDPLINQREVAAFLLGNKGLIASSELEALAGWRKPEAELFFTDCLVRFDGTVQVSENGAVYAEFDDLLRGSGAFEPGQIEYFWDEYEAQPELNGNSSMQNLLIFGMNTFNLLVSGAIVSGTLPLFFGLSGQDAVWSGPLQWLLNSPFLLGWLPFLFSLLFFLIPGMRWFEVRRATQRRYHNNLRKRIYRAIYERNGEAQPIEEMVEFINSHKPEERVTVSKIEDAVNEIMIDLNGESSVREKDGKLVYSFPILQLESTELQRLRRLKRVDNTLGGVVLDSGEY